MEIPNPPNWLTWDLPTKYLPASFHHKQTASFLKNLVKLDWNEMGGEISELVVLAVGLALRDILAVQFQEEDEQLPEDMPSWVSTSPLKLKFLHKVLECWEIQLKVTEEEISAEEQTRGRTRSAQKEGKKKKEKNKSKTVGSDSDGNVDVDEQRP